MSGRFWLNVRCVHVCVCMEGRGGGVEDHLVWSKLEGIHAGFSAKSSVVVIDNEGLKPLG